MTDRARSWLFVNAGSDFGGHEVMLLRWLEELEKDEGGAPPRLLARQGSRLLARASESVRYRTFAPHAPVAGLGAWRSLWHELQVLRHAVRELRPACVIVASGALGQHVPHVLLLRLLGTPVLLYVPLLGTFVSMGYRGGAWKDRFVRWFYAKVPCGWVAITQAQADEFCAWAQPTGRVLVLPNTVASSIERAPRVVPRTLMPDQPLLVLVLGRLNPHQKGLDMLLAHLAQAPPEDVADLHFRIVGDGDYKTRIEELLHAQPALARIVELQPWASAQHVIAESDVLLLTSRFEGVPLVMLEAMALGVPVVSSDLPGTSPYVPASTRFAVGDMRAALAILRGLRPVELRRALARSGRQTFEAHASGRAFAEHVRRLGQEIRTHFSLDEGAATAAAHRKPPHR